MMFRAVFWVVLPCKLIVDQRFRGAYCLHHQKTALNIILAAVRTWNLTMKGYSLLYHRVHILFTWKISFLRLMCKGMEKLKISSQVGEDKTSVPLYTCEFSYFVQKG
jgi:hypothetical protein